MMGTQTYNAEALAKLKSWLGTMAEKGHKKFFEIFVDNARVVHKTDNLDDFDDHEMWVDEKTKVIRVLVYNSEGSHRYQPFEYRTEFYLNELDQASKKSDQALQQSLSGLDVDKKIETALTKQKQEFAFDTLKKENTDLKTKVKEADDYIVRLEDRIQVFESQKFKLNQDTIVSIGTGILSGVVKNNPEIIDKIPPAALNGIVSAIATANKKDNNEDTESGASFSKRSDTKETEENEEEEDDDTQIKMAFLEQMQEKLDDDELEKMFGMMQYLMDNPSLINTAYGLMVSNDKKQAA
jgi:hypothetical protein